MIAELTVQHAYIEGGDFQIPPRPRCGLPGARFEFDQQAGRYRIAKIFDGENEEDIYRSPLTEVGVNVSVGDYVLAIDGEELKGTTILIACCETRPTIRFSLRSTKRLRCRARAQFLIVRSPMSRT